MERSDLDATAKLAVMTSARLDVLEHAFAAAVARLPSSAAEAVVAQMDAFVEAERLASVQSPEGMPDTYARYQKDGAIHIADQIGSERARLHSIAEPRSFKPPEL